MKIGEAFQSAGFISPEQLHAALRQQEFVPERLGDLLVLNGVVKREQHLQVLAKYFSLPLFDLKDHYQGVAPDVLRAIPKDLALKYKVFPIDKTLTTLTIATSDPLHLEAIDTLRYKCNLKIKCVLASEDEILEAIDVCYNGHASMDEHIAHFLETDTDLNDSQPDQEAILQDANHQPVIKYVQSLIVQAIKARASDVILQPKQDRVELRFRIDGVLHVHEAPPKSMLPAISSRIKILSKLNIAERRLPQDGGFKAQLGSKHIDIRASVFPTHYGESVVLRILDVSQPILDLRQLGFPEDELKRYRRLIHQPYGLLLVTGPTGSGKTTTLYASLNNIKSRDKNIVTLEDPIEYHLPFAQQSQVNPTISFDFARGLRSLLRQDPDIIMIGEIRDRETAEIAIHAAQTGHLVFATLHTNDAIGAPIRLYNMGVEPFLLTSSLIGVLAQRLVRRICPKCKAPFSPDTELLRELGCEATDLPLYKGTGCPHCYQSGFSGRLGIYELFVPDTSIHNLILQRKFDNSIRTLAQDNGMRVLRQAALDKMFAGLTTAEEVFRMTQSVCLS